MAGFCLPCPKSAYTPPLDLCRFLEAGPPPIYVGFASIMVEDAVKLTDTIYEALKLAGVRAVVSKGWARLGASSDVPSTVILIDDCPHEWLFERVSCAVHHGGAGTTAAGLRAGLGTITLPFFGDQFFWSSMVNSAGAGPEPLARHALDAGSLSHAINTALSDECRAAAVSLSKMLRTEDGARTFATDFHANLTLPAMKCALQPHRAAVWNIPLRRRSNIHLSAFAASVLLKHRLVDLKQLDR